MVGKTEKWMRMLLAKIKSVEEKEEKNLVKILDALKMEGKRTRGTKPRPRSWCKWRRRRRDEEDDMLKIEEKEWN